MYKEIIIIIAVIALVVGGNVITQMNTIKSVQDISKNLNLLREEIAKEEASKEKSVKLMEQTEKIWKERYETMAYYLEHNELEKVQTELVKLKADIDMEEYSMGVENLDNCKFILEHIKDKTALKIVNVF